MKQKFNLIAFLALILSFTQMSAQDLQTGMTCSDALTINCGETVSGSTANVPNDNTTSGAPVCVTSVGTGGQMWYTFTAATSQYVTLTTCNEGTLYDTEIQVYSGTCGALTCVAGNDDYCGLHSSVSFLSDVNQSYLVRVGGFGSGVGSYAMSMSCGDYVGGCTNPSASNYNSAATYDDGSCLYGGCTDPSALNYNQGANVDDGSCEYCDGEGSVIGSLYVCTFANGYQVLLTITDPLGNVVADISNLANNQIFNGEVCLLPGVCYTVSMTNTDGFPGWNNGYFWINVNGIQVINESLNLDATSETTIFSIDGTCASIPGCMDSTASNYNANANVDDGSCVYPIVCETGTVVTVNMNYASFPNEVSFYIVGANGDVVYTSTPNNSQGSFYSEVCLEDGCYTVIMNDSFGDGWNGGGLFIIANGMTYYFSVPSGSSAVGSFGVNTEGCVPDVASGCMDPNADNYDPEAIYSDNSCTYSGCMDSAAINYDYMATIDDGSCTYCNGEGSVLSQLYICTFSNGNYVELQIVDDQGNEVYYATNLSSGGILNVELCLQEGVCYTANMFNISGPFGWYNGYFWINANGAQVINTYLADGLQTSSVQFSIDGTCGPVAGCNDPNATNYNPEATINDGSCIYPVVGCTDSTALNYNSLATQDDGSCVYAEDCDNNLVVFQLTPGVFTGEASYTVVDANGSVVASGTGATYSYACLTDGCYTINMYDTFGDGWDGGGFLDVYSNGAPIGTFTLAPGLSYGSVSFGLNTEGCTPTVTGCMDSTALNYNPLATEDDGSCVYPENCDQNLVNITIVTQTWGSEMSWNLVAADGSIAASGSGYSSWNYYTTSVCLADGCYEMQMSDTWGDGWNGGYYMINGANTYAEGSLLYGNATTDLVGVNSQCGEVAGCMDETALNYNPSATMDDGSCIFNDVDPGLNQNFNVGLELEFNLYPNPTTGEIQMNLNNLNKLENIQVNVTGLDGKVVSTFFFSNEDQSRAVQVDMTSLSAGYYFVQVVNGANVKVLPLIKQ